MRRTWQCRPGARIVHGMPCKALAWKPSAGPLTGEVEWMMPSAHVAALDSSSKQRAQQAAGVPHARQSSCMARFLQHAQLSHWDTSAKAQTSPSCGIHTPLDPISISHSTPACSSQLLPHPRLFPDYQMMLTSTHGAAASKVVQQKHHHTLTGLCNNTKSTLKVQMSAGKVMLQ